MTSKAEVGCTIGFDKPSYFYLLEHIGETQEDRVYRESQQREEAAGMMGSPDTALYLRWLLETIGGKTAIEVGVFRGSTTTHLARGVGPKGTVYALDINRQWLDTGAVQHWTSQGVADRIKFLEGPAVTSMDTLIERGLSGTVDLVFIDANKVAYPEYYERALTLLRPGGIIAMDNVLWHGRARAPRPGDVDSETIAALNDKIAKDPRVHAVMLGIADGVYLARKL